MTLTTSSPGGGGAQRYAFILVGIDEQCRVKFFAVKTQNDKAKSRRYT